MKKIYTFVLATCLCTLQAQLFTNGTVFDYSVGDTIIEQQQQLTGNPSNSIPPTFIQRVITGKTFSSAQDSIFYTEARTINQLIGPCCPMTTIVTNTIVSFTVTNLSQSVISYSLPNTNTCVQQTDTSSVNTCSYNVHVKGLDIVPNPGFCEPTIIVHTFIAGIGVFYKYVYYNSTFPGQGHETKLVYSHKVNHPPCGNKISIITSLDDLSKLAQSLDIYPNPSEGKCQINAAQSGTMNVFNASGQLLRTISLTVGINQFDLSDFPAGIYFISANTAGKVQHSKLVKM